MLSSGESLLYVARQLGHADFSMLERRYARWKPSQYGRKGGQAVLEGNPQVWARLESLRSSGAKLSASKDFCDNDATTGGANAKLLSRIEKVAASNPATPTKDRWK